MSLSRNISGCQMFHPSQLPTDWDCVPLKDRLELLYGRALKEEIRKPGGVDVFGSNGKVGSHNVHWLRCAPAFWSGAKARWAQFTTAKGRSGRLTRLMPKVIGTDRREPSCACRWM